MLDDELTYFFHEPLFGEGGSLMPRCYAFLSLTVIHW